MKPIFKKKAKYTPVGQVRQKVVVVAAVRNKEVVFYYYRDRKSGKQTMSFVSFHEQYEMSKFLKQKTKTV